MSRVARKRMHHSNRTIMRSKRTRARTRDLDQIYEDIAKQEAATTDGALTATTTASLHTNEHDANDAPADPVATAALDENLPGLGQFYCIHCAKYFISAHAMAVHSASKPHKKRVKELKTPPYTQKDAEAAVGLRTDNSRVATMAVDKASPSNPPSTNF
ncbi:Bud site selection protein 20 [Physocladia obscura]|uniref:Bud site selection protein 20 n=1 Tax=Physocladia obscura TaxID=109957 RepID=A0AAD5SMD3_9FUNG|nr:Bud site selection protein 20 [Physocladia obscura]